MPRRRFLQSCALGSAAWPRPISRRDCSLIPPRNSADPYRGLKMGVASYSLRKFTLDQALAMMRELGLKYICLKDMHLPLASTAAECRAAHDKVDAAGITLSAAA